MPASPANAATGDLFISEYVEGSSFNKVIEIYNGTGQSVDLAAGSYSLELYSNGNSSPNNTLAMSGTIADGDVYVLANSQASQALLALSDTTASVVNFNGDDALLLKKDGVVIDSFGQVGFDPGSQWPGGGQNDTLRRNVDICAGDADELDPFNASDEWTIFGQDTFDGVGSHTANCDGGTGPLVLINEVDSDNSGTDTAEFIEIYDGGAGSTDLSGLAIVLFNGSDDASYAVFDLDGISTNSSGYFVLCGNAANVPNCDLDVSPDSNLVQNGADAVALVQGDAADFPNDTTVASVNAADIVDALIYDTNDGDDNGLAPLVNAGEPQVNEDGSGSKDTDSNQRCPNGSGGARNTSGYEQFAPTPGEDNVCEIVVPPLSCTDDSVITPIHDIQGSGLTSPLVGQEVVIEGIVTAVLPGLRGFNVQEEDSDVDGDPSTSEGIFVFAFEMPPGIAVNDRVRVQGPVIEFGAAASSLTEVSASAVATCSVGTGSVTPTTLTLPVSDLTDFEAFEGMLVNLDQSLTIVEYFNFDRFGEVVVATDRLTNPTAIVDPGPDALALSAANSLSRITIDDGRTTQNPDPAIHPGNGNIFDLDNSFRGGDLITGITGVIHHSFGLYRVQPTTYGTYTSVNPRTADHEPVGGTLEVSSFNVLNYFTTLDDSGPTCGPSGDQGCRGADNVDELNRQRDKIVAAISTLDSDIVGLIEIENNATDAAVIDLVNSLNAVSGAGTYEAIQTGTIGDDAIKVALIYKPASVTPVGPFAVLDGSVDPRFIDSKNRPALAQSFSDNSNGGVVTVAVNHLKSKGSPCDDVGDPNAGDGSGNCNGTRTAAAEALVDWLANDPTGSGDADVLIIGDLNAYDKETPIDAIVGAGYTDLVREFGGDFAYSYVFSGEFGYLDHALANDALRSQVTGTAVWHINADEPDILDYDTSFKQDAQDALYSPDPYRSSDHDPVVVGLDLCDAIAPSFDTLIADPDELWPPDHKYRDVEVTLSVSDNADPNPTVTLLSVTSSEPDDAVGNGDGRTVNDIVIIDDTHFKLRAERAGNGNGRTYTITYEATDSCGNSAIDSVTVFVPKNRGNGKA